MLSAAELAQAQHVDAGGGHGAAAVVRVAAAASGRGVHSSTFRLNVTTSSSADMFQPWFTELNNTLGGVNDRNVSG